MLEYKKILFFIFGGHVVKKNTIHICLLSSALFLSLSSTSTMAREYYKWVDANGSTHYSKTPPPKNAKKQGRVETFGTKSSTVATTQTPQNEPTPTTNNQAPTTQNSQVESPTPAANSQQQPQ